MDSPYLNPLTHIKDISPFMETDPKTGKVTFIGETLEIRIPQRYEVYDLLMIEDKVTSLAVFDMIIDGKFQTTLNLLATITISPSDQGTMTYDNVPYLVLFLNKGDVFMQTSDLVRNPGIVYAMWIEFVTQGKLLYTYKYDDLAMMFDQVRLCCGRGLGVGRSIFEAVMAFLCRDPQNVFVPYRLSKRDKPFEFIALRDVSNAPTGTMARLTGSYFDDALTASLRYEITEHQPYEDILRNNPQAIGLKPANI